MLDLLAVDPVRVVQGPRRHQRRQVVESRALLERDLLWPFPEWLLTPQRPKPWLHLPPLW